MNLLMAGQMKRLTTLIITNVIKDMIYVPVIETITTVWKTLTDTSALRSFTMMIPIIITGMLKETFIGILTNKFVRG